MELKALCEGILPLAVLSNPEVIANAPYEMTAAGLGDILAKSVSSLDWYLNHFLFDDYYCEASVNLIADIEPLYFDHPKDIYERKPEAMEALFQGLLLDRCRHDYGGNLRSGIRRRASDFPHP